MSAIFGELLNFQQGTGPDIQLRVFGDEHYARYETPDGFTVVYDPQLRLFCYANIEGNQLVSTKVAVGDHPPAGIVRHLQETITARRAKAEERRLRRLRVPGDDDIVRTFGPNQGLLAGRRLSLGTVRGLTILVNFQDVTTTITAADLDDMINGANYTRNGNICSVTEYFRRVSNSRLTYTNTVVGPFTLSHNRAFYLNTLLVEEALQFVAASGVDFTQFDSQHEGIIDAVNILYAGQSVYQDELWPHNSSIDLQFGSMRTNLYLLTGAGRNANELSIGTFCHENGHLLCRFPDMYDYGNRDGDDKDSAGIGHYCLMGAGNHLDFGRSPSPVCAYLRDLAGWCDTVVDLNAAVTQQARHGDYGVVLKYRTSKPSEYFIVENRSNLDLDRALPSGGLAIYHCDTLGSNEFQQGTAAHHYQCALLQADGRRDLESNANQGDGSDLFVVTSGVVLSSTSNPGTREWDGRDSGLVIADISEPGDSIDFRLGGAAPAQNFQGQVAANLAIPDNNPNGVASSIAVNVSGVVGRIRVSVDITHTYIGDLQVELQSPTGRRAILHARSGGSQNDLRRTYDSNSPGQLSNMIGQPAQGNWILSVRDAEAIDTGKLNTWSLNIDTSPV